DWFADCCLPACLPACCCAHCRPKNGSRCCCCCCWAQWRAWAAIHKMFSRSRHAELIDSTGEELKRKKERENENRVTERERERVPERRKKAQGSPIEGTRQDLTSRQCMPVHPRGHTV